MALLAPTIAGQDVELWEIEYHPRARGALLRIYIDRPDGVTVDDCERVSYAVSAVLDAEDPIPGQYTLEVSSPGLDRVLRTREHFARYVGQAVRVETTAAIDGRKRFSGRLTSVGDSALELEVAGQVMTIALAAVHKARLVG